MTNQEAKRILDNMGVFVFFPIEGRVSLDGTFLADELEALAKWMRDPESVMNAEDKTP